MARYIDADKLKAHYAWWECTESGNEQKKVFDTIIDLQPTADVVEVVRCRECIHYWKNWKDEEPDDEVAVCLASPRDDAFCSEGERRDDGDGTEAG